MVGDSAEKLTAQERAESIEAMLNEYGYSIAGGCKDDTIALEVITLEIEAAMAQAREEEREAVIKWLEKRDLEAMLDCLCYSTAADELRARRDP